MTAAFLHADKASPGIGPRRALAWPWVLVLVALLGLATSPAIPARAADTPATGFVWDEVAVTVRLRDDGAMSIREDLTVQFTGGPFRQGFREIPLANIDSISDVTVTEVNVGPARPYRFVGPSAYSRDDPRSFTYQRVGTVLRIEWSFPPTSSTTRSWVITYTARGALRVYADAQPPYQEIRWVGVDAALTQDAPVTTATLAFILPRRVDPQAARAESNGAPFGETNGQAWFWRAEHLGPGQSLEASLQFPPLVAARKPAWQGTYDRQVRQDAPANLAFLGLALLTAVGGSVGLLVAWWLRGRDPLPGPTPDRLATPPDDTPPGVVGALLDEQVDERDFLATLIDLARRDVVRITGVVQPVASNQRPMVLTLLQPDAPLAPFERALLETLFAGTWWRYAQVRLPLDDPTGLRESLLRVAALLYGELVQRGYFTAPPPDTRETWRYAGIGLWLLAALLFLGGFVAGAALMWLLLPCIALVAIGSASFVVSRYMPQKSQVGVDAAARWRAFRNHLAAVDRLGALDSDRTNFERYLPYAVAFGIERPWVAAFARGSTASPGWRDTLRPSGSWIPHAGRPGGGMPASGLNPPDLPDLSHVGGLQNVSSLASASLQSSSGTLFDLFNEVGYTFKPELVLGNTTIDGEDALKFGFEVLGAVLSSGRGSGGGRGGFS